MGEELTTEVKYSLAVQEARHSIEVQKVELQALIDGGKLPTHIKSADTALLIKQMGNELGFKTIQAFHYIIPIQGRLSLSAKAIGALMKKNGISYKTLEDAVWVYKDGTTGDYNIEKEGIGKAIDRRTTILFKRWYNAFGVEEVVDEQVTYTWLDAKGAELTTKDNWMRMPK